MAKRARRKRQAEAGTVRASVPTGGQLATFAEDLGRILGTAESKARSWLDQRKSIATQLAQVRDKADQLLRQLTGGAAGMAAAAGRGRGTRGRRTAEGARRKSTRKRRKLSAEARARIAEAQRARWARQRAAAAAPRATKTRRRAKTVESNE